MPDRKDYLDDGLRPRDDREGFGDDAGTRVGRPDGAERAHPAPRDASAGVPPGQAGTNASPVADGLEGSILSDAPAGQQQDRVRQASRGVDEGPAAGDERRIDDL